MARTNSKNTSLIPAGVSPEAGILMVGSEFLFVARRDGAVHQKYVSPGAVRQAFAAEPIDSGWLPPGVCRWGISAKGNWMLRWHPPAQYKVWLPDRKRALQVPMPALVFFGQGTHYYLWAMNGEAFNPKAMLFNAPCANVNELGLICWGENKHPNLATGCFEAMWQTFWDAPFSGSWATNKSKAYPESANERLLTLAKVKAKCYPMSDLVPLSHRLFPSNCTLDRAVDRMVRRGGEDL